MISYVVYSWDDLILGYVEATSEKEAKNIARDMWGLSVRYVLRS